MKSAAARMWRDLMTPKKGDTVMTDRGPATVAFVGLTHSGWWMRLWDGRMVNLFAVKLCRWKYQIDAVASAMRLAGMPDKLSDWNAMVSPNGLCKVVLI